MELFCDQPLRKQPHIAVFSSSKVGNFVVITPLLRGLKAKYPDCTLDFFGSDITEDFESHCPYIDWRFSLYSDRLEFLEELAANIRQRRQQAGDYDLAINCDEFSEINLVVVTAIRPQYISGAGLSADFGRKLDTKADPMQAMLKDDDWNSPAFLERHQSRLSSNYISEIFCRIAYVDTDYFRLEVPSQPPDFEVPDLLIHVTATRSAKQWPLDYWLEVLRWCEERNLSVGLLGSRPELQQTLYHGDRLEDELLSQRSLVDLRGRTSLTQLAGALAQAKLCITLDTGPLHIATAVQCPTIAIFGNDQETLSGASPVRLWAPKQEHVKLALSNFSCTVCEENQFRNRDCLLESHACMEQIKPSQVIQLMREFLNG